MYSFKNFQTNINQILKSKSSSISPSIINSAAYKYADMQEAKGIFDGSLNKEMYSRLGNPTNKKLEEAFSKIENGFGAIATSSGMSAIALACMSLLKAGDEAICIGGLFGGTFAFFNDTLKRFGIKTKFIDANDFESLINSIKDKSKFIFCESVGNPNMKISDIKKIAKIAKEKDIALIVDNTVTPLSIQAINLGADIVVYSTTKIITGNSSALGGLTIFSKTKKKFFTKRYKDIKDIVEKYQEKALFLNAKKRVLRDIGFSANAFNSYLTLIGLETLVLRLKHINKNIQILSKALKKEGFDIRHPSLKNHENNKLFKGYYKKCAGPLFTINLNNEKRAFNFLHKLKRVTLTANLGDTRTLGLEMSSTIYKEYDKKSKKFLGVNKGLIRFSLGLEDPYDIINDFKKAYKKI